MSSSTSLNAIFLDTAVFDSFNYTYDSPTMQAFSSACIEAEMHLVVPDPTEKEIRRHIRERSKNAIEQLMVLRKKAPFLTEWSKFPSEEIGIYDHWEPANIGLKQWLSFKKELSAVQLDYGHLDIAEIMRWYDLKIAPFGKGKKSKEFPDAFAIALLNEYAKTNSKYIAVVSQDTDLKKACDRYTNLLYFYSVRALTENILEGSESVASLRDTIDEDTRAIESAIENEAEDISVHHTFDNIEAELNQVTGATLIDYSVIAIGQFDCTIAFEAEIELNVNLDTWDTEWAAQYGDVDQDHDCHGVFYGVATVKFSDDLESVIEVPAVEIESPELEIELDPEEQAWF